MFKKFISNLPFNPALLGQVNFYVHRLRREESVRRLGVGLVAMAFVFQIFVSLSPPQSTLATSDNDIIYGGGSRSELALHVRNNDDQLHHQDLQAIYGYYGITADILAQGQETSISTVGSNNYYSIGRNNRDSHDIRVNIPGARTNIFSRRLDGWAHKSWPAIKIPGKSLWVLKDCGNIVTVGNYQPPQEPPPNLQLEKQNNPRGKVKPGDLITYSLIYANTGGQAALTAILDTLPANTTFISASSPLWRQVGTHTNLKFVPDNAFAVLSGTNGQAYPITVSVRVNNDAPNGVSLCNNASIVTYQTTTSYKTWDKDTVCNNVQLTCPDGSPLPPNGVCHTTNQTTPAAACLSLDVTGQETDFKRHFTTQLRLENGATVRSYTYQFGDGSTAQTVRSTTNPSSVDHTFKQAGVYLVVVTAETSLGTRTSRTCQVNTVVKSASNPLPILSKKARNITQNKPDANGTMAAGGDVIEYSLTTANPNNQTIKHLHLRSEDLSDISEYADLDMASISGASYDATTKILSWPDSLDLAGNASVVKTFRVTVKNPIPQTPASRSDSQSFDLVMFNEYGNQVTIRLPGSVGKTVEQTLTTSIPQTGPGTGLFISTAVVMLASYLYARSRTMRREFEIVKAEYSTGGV